MGTFTEMNDPMEGFFESDSLKKGEATILCSVKEELRLCSLSPASKVGDVLMWAHYANSASGCCFVVKPTGRAYCEVNGRHEPVDMPAHLSLHKVKYIEQPEFSHLVETFCLPQRCADSFFKPAKEILTNKFSCWKYEEEWRYFQPCLHDTKTKKYKAYLDVEVLKVYIGPNSDKNNDIDAVLCYAEEYGVPVEAMLREHMTYYSSSNFPNEKCCPERQWKETIRETHGSAEIKPYFLPVRAGEGLAARRGLVCS